MHGREIFLLLACLAVIHENTIVDDLASTGSRKDVEVNRVGKKHLQVLDESLLRLCHYVS